DLIDLVRAPQHQDHARGDEEPPSDDDGNLAEEEVFAYFLSDGKSLPHGDLLILRASRRPGAGGEAEPVGFREALTSASLNVLIDVAHDSDGEKREQARRQDLQIR